MSRTLNVGKIEHVPYLAPFYNMMERPSKGRAKARLKGSKLKEIRSFLNLGNNRPGGASLVSCSYTREHSLAIGTANPEKIVRPKDSSPSKVGVLSLSALSRGSAGIVKDKSFNISERTFYRFVDQDRLNATSKFF